MKFAYFNPTVFAVADVAANVLDELRTIVDSAHQKTHLDDSRTQGISIRGGQQIQLLPNKFDLDISSLKHFVEHSCKEYLMNLLSVNGSGEFDLYTPVLVSAWTIKQQQGHYQALHSHQAHISGNIYLDFPDLDPDANESDGSLEFSLPVVRNPATFHFVDQWRFKPQVGKMVMFPSYIPHTVYPWRGLGNRTILAWDVKLIQK